jgi:hypothetical protein
VSDFWHHVNRADNSDTGYRYATAPEGDNDAICPAFRGNYNSQLAGTEQPADRQTLPTYTHHSPLVYFPSPPAHPSHSSVPSSPSLWTNIP